ncbi:thermonuclease family protein [Candidatus Peribacteria bacterium]|nr:thermonuclease family protein [Candidatus Peribacteria bacterium]
MRKTLALIVLLTACNAPSIDEQNTTSIDSVDLVHVIDGDTIVVTMVDGTEEHIRIIGIDAPEKGECGSSEATDALDNLLQDTSLSLISDPTGDNRDKYGRLLRYVQANGNDVGAKLLQEGYVKTYPWFPHAREAQYNAIDGEERECP